MSIKRKVTVVIIALVLIGAAGYLYFHKPVKHVVIKPKPAPVQIAHGIKPPYNECTPNTDDSQEKLHQAEILNTESQMAKYNDTPDNTNNPDLQRLNDLYNEQITEFDTCNTIEG